MNERKEPELQLVEHEKPKRERIDVLSDIRVQWESINTLVDNVIAKIRRRNNGS